MTTAGRESADTRMTAAPAAAVPFSAQGHIAVITINRPEARNAINADVAVGLEAGIDRLEKDDALWVGVLTAVPPVFSAGADLKENRAGRRVNGSGQIDLADHGRTGDQELIGREDRDTVRRG